MSEGDYYSVSQAARVLKVTPGRIRQMLGTGELEGVKDDNGRWRIPDHLVHDRPRPPRVERMPPTSSATQALQAKIRAVEVERRLEELYEVEEALAELESRAGNQPCRGGAVGGINR